jgi:predicted N-formylglutamate amidohydrolase
LDAVAIQQTYSRLVIDCNRPPHHPGSIVETSDGTVIPANRGLTAEAVEQRLAEIHRPYHGRISDILRDRVATGRRHILLFLHSFTPTMDGFDRPWRYGVLHLNNSPFSAEVLKRLRAELGEAAGDNQPYSMDGTDYSAPTHAKMSGFDYLELEVRQDLIADAAGQRAAAAWLLPILADAFEAL